MSPLSRRTFLKGAGLLTASALDGRPLALYRTSAAGDAGRPLLLAHYMPWYQTPDVSGFWGWHWTMEHFDPSQPDAEGRLPIASHYMPLTGPYDSSDDAILEYQTLLMKLSGIDGVIVDWYGTADFRDYAACNRSTGKLFEHIQRAGMRFAICYEDRTVKYMVEEGVLTRDETLLHGQDVMRYMHEQWFGDDAYLKYNEQPVLLTFGPQYFRSSDDWASMFAVVEPRPVLVTLDGNMVLDALASYPWPVMYGIEANQAVVETQLTQFYRKARRWDYLVGGAWPGFDDIYAEAGVQASYGHLDAQDGAIFEFTLQLALEQNPDVIQLITWNDYGEGTIIEPTEEFGYRYLEMIQQTRRTLEPATFSFAADDLHIPLEILTLRRTHAGDADSNARLDAAVEAVLTGDLTAARQHLSDVAGTT